MITHTTLATLDQTELTDAFNTVYTGYVVPMHVTEEWMARHVTANNIDLATSPLWLEDGEVVGLAALGFREQRGWVGGFGVAAPYRGRGISHALMTATLDSARAHGASHVQLEVISQNAAAIRTYQHAGFRITRDLLLFEFERAADAEIAPTLSLAAIEMQNVDFDGLTIPCWQREPASLATIPGLSVLGMPNGTTHVCLTDNPRRIHDIGGASVTALTELVSQLPNLSTETLRLVNEPEESVLCDILTAHGWRATLRQHEMHIALA